MRLEVIEASVFDAADNACISLSIVSWQVGQYHLLGRSEIGSLFETACQPFPPTSIVLERHRFPLWHCCSIKLKFNEDPRSTFLVCFALFVWCLTKGSSSSGVSVSMLSAIAAGLVLAFKISDARSSEKEWSCKEDVVSEVRKEGSEYFGCCDVEDVVPTR